MALKLFLLASAGGALGAGARHLVNTGFARWIGGGFPWATFAVNVVGCFLMGVLVEALALRYAGSPEARTFLVTGVLGGFTTFSAFSLDFALLVGRGEAALAGAYAVRSIALAIGAFFAGQAAGRLMF